MVTSSSSARLFYVMGGLIILPNKLAWFKLNMLVGKFGNWEFCLYFLYLFIIFVCTGVNYEKAISNFCGYIIDVW